MKKHIWLTVGLLLLCGCQNKPKQYSKTEGSIGSDVLEVEHLEQVVVPELLKKYPRDELNPGEEEKTTEDVNTTEDILIKEPEPQPDDISSYGINYDYQGDEPDLSSPMIAGMPFKLRQYFHAFRRGYHEVPEGSYAYVMPHEPYIYILEDWMVMDTESMYHEMAHIYGFATYVHEMPEWDDIYNDEWQDGTYGSTNPYEAFAESVAGYFITPELLDGKPRSRAFVDQIFKDAPKPIIPEGAL